MLQQARNQAKEGKINVEALENIAKVGGVEAGKPEASSPYSSNSSAGIKMNIDKETGEIKQPFFKTPTTTTPTQRAIALVLHVQIHRKLNNSAKEETDINTIVDRFLKTGALPPVRVPPTYWTLPKYSTSNQQ